MDAAKRVGTRNVKKAKSTIKSNSAQPLARLLELLTGQICFCLVLGLFVGLNICLAISGTVLIASKAAISLLEFFF